MTSWRATLGLIVIAAVIASCGNADQTTATPSAAESGAPGSSAGASTVPSTSGVPGASSDQAGLLLTEVLFAPQAGGSAFVEVSNTGPAPIDTSGAIVRLASGDIPLELPDHGLQPGGQVTVWLDGKGTTDGLVIHAEPGLGLDATSGVVVLLDRAGGWLDRIAWGSQDPSGVPTGDGGIVPAGYAPGGPIARAPGATEAGESTAWVAVRPAAASPGTPNPMPTASVLLPLSGSVLDGAETSLAWYPVPGAVSYGVKITSATSSAPVLDTTTTEPRLDAGPLPAGTYAWRVAARAADGSTSAPSDESTFEIATATAAITLAAFGGQDLAADDAGRQLSVANLSQRKDTSMLLLERNVEHGAHAWDADHGKLDPSDPADNKNCAIASVSMVNHFFGGDLSQDRIGYELLKGRQPGPEWDLPYGTGFSQAQVTTAMTFALGAPPTHIGTGSSPDEIWAAVTASLDAGRPVVAAGLRHTFVFTGYGVSNGTRLFTVNDPWNYAGHGGTTRYSIDANGGQSAAVLDLWVPPAGAVGRRDESSIRTDADGDGVVDFDETMRFQTDPSNPDSDGDKVPDKPDVVSGIFDATFGYARHPEPDGQGRDFDFDGVPTERDPDSDRGGCQDGDEDADRDGHRTGGETWNFDTQDDRCSGWRGTMTAMESWDVTYGQGTATSTFDGVWQIDEAGDAECPPDQATGGCSIFRPAGTIAWTWDSSHTEPGRECHETTSGSLATGQELHADQQVLRLRAVDPDHLEYWGIGNFVLRPSPMTCGNMQTGSKQPPRFFEILDGSATSNDVGSDGNTCYGTTWQIEATADTIKGTCYAYKNDHTSLQFTWDLKRVGGG